MKVGFTGSREGMSATQGVVFARLFDHLKATDFHHGDCVGADHEAHLSVRGIDEECWIVVHPPKKSDKRAFCVADEYRQPYDYLVRDGHIVEETECLIATPNKMSPETGGTWYTINYAKSHKKPVYLIKPDGVIELHDVNGLVIAFEIPH